MISMKQKYESFPRCLVCVHSARGVSNKRMYCYREGDDISEWDESEYDEIEPSDCDSCNRFKPGIEFPIKCSDILIEERNRDCECDSRIGNLAAVSPQDGQFQGKTYLGRYLGELPLRINLLYSGDCGENVVDVSMYRSPAFFVPSINSVVYGEECKWEFIESSDDLQTFGNQNE